MDSLAVQLVDSTLLPFMRSAFLFSLLCVASMAAPKPPAGFGTPDVEITLGTKHGQMRFDQEALAVQPGAKVKITLKNTCEMLHNWVLVKGGTADRDRGVRQGPAAWRAKHGKTFCAGRSGHRGQQPDRHAR